MNAIILAAGMSSRFVPLSFEKPKALLKVRGEVLIERQIRQLREAGINDIVVVVGYKRELFGYLTKQFGVRLIYNADYARYNNISSVVCAIDYLADTYVCSSDNYFMENVFLHHPTTSEYAAMFAHGKTGEYCLEVDGEDNIVSVSVGGEDAWYMVGHVFFHSMFSRKFKPIIIEAFLQEENRQKYWEDIYISHITDLPKMKIKRFDDGVINEFDSLEELRHFDKSYCRSGSDILRYITDALRCEESQICNMAIAKNKLTHAFYFDICSKEGRTSYLYYEKEGKCFIENVP
ncbi:choline-phosphate cytidylyltransferase [Prevotella sp. oral taxon 376]|uniref:NTP transferase domain-containing protein n=1 Tax=Prevotella sp. oral taxon 376 TaxID=712466 RepID=UPI000D1F72C3|nr:NTP transferase domain-containing protein [Prevotella sp. oral taxon 376]PTL32320.1 choline-phosphate cytidylyltransferase [Prevotella sp. oral taxon 376]